MGCIALFAAAAFAAAVLVYMGGLMGLVTGFIALMGGYMTGLVAFVIGFILLS